MKYLVLLCDGMADYKFEGLKNKTPMMLANKPNMDRLAKTATVGLAKTVADHLKPGSDVANLSVMGYDPAECYTGRSPLEAASIGIALTDTDVTLRCNLVTLSDEENYEDKTMIDYSAGDISSEDAAEIIKSVQEAFGNDVYSFYAGVSYRHCLVVKNGTVDLGNMTPPHDISGRVVGEYLSTHENAAPLVELMKKSVAVLKDHPVNKRRIAEGKRPANSIWLWGEGTKPQMQSFKDKYGVNMGIVSAVDLIKGIGKLAGCEVAEVEGATGYIDTNFKGKAEAAADLFKRNDIVYVHVEAPDECGHRGEAENKIKAIELIDRHILSRLVEELEKYGEYRILIMPDHPTPLITMTHARDAVPFLLYDNKKAAAGCDTFTEDTAAASGVYYDHAPDLMGVLLEK
ncbi:MAG: cofactor-independent phosphoglycerate mutase [Clostridia bacterium]|nr:cofactor-independent phosphoglycerate mutase [Clostridia bacterium]